VLVELARRGVNEVPVEAGATLTESCCVSVCGTKRSFMSRPNSFGASARPFADLAIDRLAERSPAASPRSTVLAITFCCILRVAR
jgi:riboflavin biosynthesis pyrimidine reductase